MGKFADKLRKLGGLTPKEPSADALARAEAEQRRRLGQGVLGGQPTADQQGRHPNAQPVGQNVDPAIGHNPALQPGQAGTDPQGRQPGEEGEAGREAPETNIDQAWDILEREIPSELEVLNLFFQILTTHCLYLSQNSQHDPSILRNYGVNNFTELMGFDINNIAEIYAAMFGEDYKDVHSAVHGTIDEPGELIREVNTHLHNHPGAIDLADFLMRDLLRYPVETDARRMSAAEAKPQQIASKIINIVRIGMQKLPEVRALTNLQNDQVVRATRVYEAIMDAEEENGEADLTFEDRVGILSRLRYPLRQPKIYDAATAHAIVEGRFTGPGGRQRNLPQFSPPPAQSPPAPPAPAPAVTPPVAPVVAPSASATTPPAGPVATPPVATPRVATPSSSPAATGAPKAGKYAESVNGIRLMDFFARLSSDSHLAEAYQRLQGLFTAIKNGDANSDDLVDELDGLTIPGIDLLGMTIETNTNPDPRFPAFIARNFTDVNTLNDLVRKVQVINHLYLKKPVGPPPISEDAT